MPAARSRARARCHRCASGHPARIPARSGWCTGRSAPTWPGSSPSRLGRPTALAHRAGHGPFRPASAAAANRAGSQGLRRASGGCWPAAPARSGHSRRWHRRARRPGSTPRPAPASPRSASGSACRRGASASCGSIARNHPAAARCATPSLPSAPTSGSAIRRRWSHHQTWSTCIVETPPTSHHRPWCWPSHPCGAISRRRWRGFGLTREVAEPRAGCP